MPSTAREPARPAAATAAVRTPAGSTSVRALQPVGSTTRRQEVTDALRRALLSGELRPGQRLKEVELAQALGVSRPTLREAVQELVHEGALVQSPYRGTRVAETSPQALLDLADVRVPLESLAAVSLAHDPAGTGLQALHQASDAHAAAVRSGDVAAAALTHVELHRTLWIASGNGVLASIWPIVAAQIGLALGVDQAVRADPQRDVALHGRLVQVIETGDDAEIRAQVERHIRSSTDELLQLMERQSTNETNEGHADDH